ncbi:hypothetical protein HBB04_04181 [Pseudomonas coronafaciens]|nr:hypothetical protein HBB04_04181 [Pseudomonas coronafaciens]
MSVTGTPTLEKTSCAGTLLRPVAIGNVTRHTLCSEVLTGVDDDDRRWYEPE